MPSRSSDAPPGLLPPEGRPRLDDPSLLLELALAAGMAPEPGGEGEAFLRVLRDRAGLEAAVWHREGDRLRLDCGSTPLAAAAAVAVDHPLAQAVGREGVLVTLLPDERFEGVVAAQTGALAACGLGVLGLVVLRASGDAPLRRAEVEALRPVLEHFEAGRRTVRRYERLRAEVAEGGDAWAARHRLLDGLAAEPALGAREQVQRALALTADFLGLDISILSQVEGRGDDGIYTVEMCHAPGIDLAPGQQFPLGQTYCAITLAGTDALAIDHMGVSEYAVHPCYEAFQLESYIGAPVYVAGTLFGTLNFSAAAPKRPAFTEADLDLLRLVASWMSTKLEQEQASEALRRTQQRLKRVLTAAPDAFVYADTDRTIQFVNPAFERLFGLAEEDVAGRRTKMLYADAADFERQQRQRYNLTAAERLDPYIVRYRRREGSTFLGETVGAPVEDGAGQRIGFMGFIRDVTVREEAQLALAAEKAHYEGIVEVATDLIYRADAEGRFTYVNPTALRRFGYEADELLGRHFSTLVRQDRRAEVMAFYQEQMTKRQSTTYLELPVLARNGEAVWVGQNVQVLWDQEHRRPIGIQAVARDITEQKRLEDALREAKTEAEASGRAKERFLANMSHEIRTPLNAVLGLTHLLAETTLADEQTEYVHGITAAADTLLSLVNDVLDFARLGAGKLSFEEVPFQPAELLHDLVLLLRPRAEAKDLTLRLTIDPAVPDELVGDPHRLRQVVINLVSNAVKFTEVGGVTVRVAPAPGEQDDLFRLRFEVIDTGIGIAESQQERIFESFTQARSDAARTYGGSGLGLAIVKELVEGQEGTVTVTSREAHGSRFVVTLPFQQHAATLTSPEHNQEIDLQGLRVLLVEDIPANQFVATRMLERWGVTVALAEDGVGAVRQVSERPEAFDLVLMDLQMPEMDGIAATRAIRGEVGLSNEQLPIVALTASVLAQQRNEVLAAGFDDFVLKPFDPEQLRRCMASLTGRIQEPDRPPINESVLERYALGDAGFIAELARLFCREVPGKVAALAEAAEAGRWEEVRALAHQTKTQAAYVGAEALAEALTDVERLAKQGASVEARTGVGRVRALCGVAEKKLREFAPEVEETEA